MIADRLAGEQMSRRTRTSVSQREGKWSGMSDSN